MVCFCFPLFMSRLTHNGYKRKHFIIPCVWTRDERETNRKPLSVFRPYLNAETTEKITASNICRKIYGELARNSFLSIFFDYLLAKWKWKQWMEKCTSTSVLFFGFTIDGGMKWMDVWMDGWKSKFQTVIFCQVNHVICLRIYTTM